MRTFRRSPVLTPTDGAVAVVDAALGMTAHRRLVPVDDALRLLRNVYAAIESEDPPPGVDRIITEATESYAGHVIVDRDRVVDPLLDIRLVLSR